MRSHPVRQSRVIPLLRASLLVALAGCLAAVDLNGLPVPGRLDTPEWQLDVGDSDIGPAGAGAHDDWRVGHGDVAWDQGWIAAALDFSVLTSQDPSGAPMYWGLPDPAIKAQVGAGRSDELTMSVALRAHQAIGPWHSWEQAGPGLQLSGDFGGKELQNDFHGLIGDQSINLPYEHPGLRAAGLVHAGAGAKRTLAGPLGFDARTQGLLTTSGWSRWRVEGMLLVAAGADGLWVGVRQDGAAGHALTTIADAVARHESGLGLFLGLQYQYRQFQFGAETTHNLRDDGQDGYISVGYLPEADGYPVGDSSGTRTLTTRTAVCALDSRVAGMGAEVAVGSSWRQLPPWLETVVGLRDQHMRLPNNYDLSGRRLMLWSGLAAEPRLWGGPAASVQLHFESGVGMRDDHISSHGFENVDGSDSRTYYVPLARAAAGVGTSVTTGRVRLGLLGLVEATAAPVHEVTINVYDPLTTSVVRKQEQVAVDGSSWGLLAAFTMDWNW